MTDYPTGVFVAIGFICLSLGVIIYCLRDRFGYF